jgi:hypothetical protein
MPRRVLAESLKRRLATVALAAAVGCTGEGHHAGAAGHPDAALPNRVDVEVHPRTPYLTNFSCMEQCHEELTPNPMVRPLVEFHAVRDIAHGEGVSWCTSCHSTDDYDSLVLNDRTTVSLDESYRLCAQCHGDKFQDWLAGIHGLQTGSWNGRQQRRSCTFCHDPHVPGLPTLESLPPPPRAPGSVEVPDAH